MMSSQIIGIATEDHGKKNSGGRSEMKSYLLIYWLGEKKLKLLIISVFHLLMLSLFPHNQK